MKTAVIYARYSSERQTEQSIEGQLHVCNDYAKRNDLVIVGTYIDRAMTGTNDNREDFQRMLKDSDKKSFDYVLVYKLDRFSRNKYEMAIHRKHLKDNGVKILSAMENIPETPEGILLESLLEGMAEYYSAELSEKTKRGMKENALKCKVNGVVVPLGYVEDGEHRFAIDEAYAPVVREVFALYLDGKGYKDIAHFLAEKGIRQKNGKSITPNVVYTMLRNRKYIGEYKFGDTVIENGVPRIISDDLFNAVQNKIAQNRKAPARKKAIDEYLLTTKLFCGKCGAMMVGESGHSMTGRIYQYYRCVHTKKVKTCDKKPVRKDWIEDLVVAEAIRILSDQGIVE